MDFYFLMVIAIFDFGAENKFLSKVSLQRQPLQQSTNKITKASGFYFYLKSNELC